MISRVVAVLVDIAVSPALILEDFMVVAMIVMIRICFDKRVRVGAHM